MEGNPVNPIDLVSQIAHADSKGYRRLLKTMEATEVSGQTGDKWNRARGSVN